MQIPFSLLFAIILSLDVFAAPLPNANVEDNFALEARKATKVAAKKPPVKAKAPAIKAKPLPKKVAPKPTKPPGGSQACGGQFNILSHHLVSFIKTNHQKKPVTAPAKKPGESYRCAAPCPTTYLHPAAKPPVAKKPVVKPAAKKVTAPAKKPAAKPPAAKVAAKPAAKPPVKPAAKKVTAPTKKPGMTGRLVTQKPSAKASKPAAKAPVKPVTTGKTPPANAKPAAKVPASCALRKPAAKRRADAEDLTARASTPITACGVNIRNGNVATLCEQQKFSFTFANDALVKSTLTRRVVTDGDDPKDGDFIPPPEPKGSSHCDHVLELQVLKKTLDGLTTGDIPDLMAPIKAAINAKSNLFLLDEKLNQVKRDEVTASLKGTAATPSLQNDLSKQRIAVDQYLTDTSVNGPSITLAKKLDDLADEMLAAAEKKGLANIQSCAGTTAAADKKALTAAKAKLKTSPTITSAWDDVLAHVAAQAKI
ncbi:hypothetical protein MVEN_00110500 [Mycena venus]|uniref:Uncharacterized protein n=1 Tax=Mycena venus TaxID=2733690 RepID=A0A8H6Z536_9AGAR|nr:hypothetical protein MVEN_00110500 [Mycena venus]